MKYRVGRKQNRVILDEKGYKVAECLKGNEDVAKQICDLLNEHGLVSELPKHVVSKCNCSLLVACEICGDEKGLDGDFWKNKDVC